MLPQGYQFRVHIIPARCPEGLCELNPESRHLATDVRRVGAGDALGEVHDPSMEGGCLLVVNVAVADGVHEQRESEVADSRRARGVGGESVAVARRFGVISDAVKKGLCLLANLIGGIRVVHDAEGLLYFCYHVLGIGAGGREDPGSGWVGHGGRGRSRACFVQVEKYWGGARMLGKTLRMARGVGAKVAGVNFVLRCGTR